MQDVIRALEIAIAEIDYLMNEGLRIDKAELAKLKALAEHLSAVIDTYEMPIFRLIRE
jgi:hypothetical protein